MSVTFENLTSRALRPAHRAGRPVSAIPGRGNVDFIDEIRLTVAGTAGGTVVDCAKLGLGALAVGTVGDGEKAGWVLATMAGFGIDVSGMQRLSGFGPGPHACGV